METTSNNLLIGRTEASNGFHENQSYWSNGYSSQPISTVQSLNEFYTSLIPTELIDNLSGSESPLSNSFHTTKSNLPEVSEIPAQLYVMVTLRSLVLITSFLANVLVLYAYATTRKLRTYTNYYIVSLAVADLFSGGVLPIRGIYREFSGDWPFSEAFCTCFTYIDHIFLQATFLMTLVICFDRLRATNMPLKHLSEKTSRHACVLISLAFLIPVLLWAPIIVILPYAGVISRVQPPICYGPYARYPALLVFTILVLSWVPMIATVIMYAFVYSAVIRTGMDKKRLTGKKTISDSKSKREAMETHHEDPRLKSYRLEAETSDGVQHSSQQTSSKGVYSISGGLQGCANPAYEDSEEASHQARDPSGTTGAVSTETRLSTAPQAQSSPAPARYSHRAASRREGRLASLRATRTLTYILTTMVISALPWSVFALWAAIDPRSLPLSINTIFDIFGWLSHLSSMVNPFCYAVGNPLFKAAFVRILCCRRNTTRYQAERSSDRQSRTFQK